jgi:hypothetical protein
MGETMTAAEIATRIANDLENGGLTRREAETLLGFVLLESLVEGDFRRPELDSPIRTYYRRCRALRRLGLLGERGGADPVAVDW